MNDKRNKYTIEARSDKVPAPGKLKDIKNLLIENGFKNKDIYKNLGFLFFILHWGRQIDHEKRKGYFFFSIPTVKNEVLVLRKRLDSSSPFWVFVHPDDIPFLSFEYYLARMSEYMMKKGPSSTEEAIEILKESIYNPKEVLERLQVEEDPICTIPLHEISLDFLLRLSRTLQVEGEIDPFQLFLYFYALLVKECKVVEMEAYIKEWNEVEWDVVCYDKGKSEGLLLIEISTGHPDDRFVTKVHNMIHALKKDAYVLYMSRFDEKKESILNLMEEKFGEKFIFINTSLSEEKGEDLLKLEGELRVIYEEVLENIDRIIDIMREPVSKSFQHK